MLFYFCAREMSDNSGDDSSLAAICYSLRLFHFIDDD